MYDESGEFEGLEKMGLEDDSAGDISMLEYDEVSKMSSSFDGDDDEDYGEYYDEDGEENEDKEEDHYYEDEEDEY